MCVKERQRGGEGESGATCLNMRARSQERGGGGEKEEEGPLFPLGGRTGDGGTGLGELNPHPPDPPPAVTALGSALNLKPW